MSLSNTMCRLAVMVYRYWVPKLWTETVDAHRAAVRGATLEATASLVAEHGLTGVTMSQIAYRAGIGRATLYKYFPDLQAVLAAWHERQISSHLQHLHGAVTAQAPFERLRQALSVYATIQSHARSHGGGDLAAMLHHSEHVDHAREQLRAFLRDLIVEAAAAGDVRTDTDADDLAVYCLHALTAAAAISDPDATGRLVDVTLAGLRP
jgi:AcrR family transcriptional regulator